LYRGNLLTHKVVYNPHHHIAKNYLALAYALQAPKDEVPFLKRAFDPKEIALPPFSPNTNRLEHVRQKILAHLPADCDPKAPWVLLNPNSSDMLIQRRWPVERFIELAQKIVTEHPHCTILITGASNERQQAERMVSDMHHPRIISIAGALDLQDLPYLYAQSSAMITNDSGPAHFAALAHLPTIVLFGPETPHLYRPLGAHTRTLHANLFCSPCVSAANHRKSPCSDPQCMMAIDVKDVYNCFENIIQSQAPPP
jgi:ADP-heptose:LPS heptosyltransferase